MKISSFALIFDWSRREENEFHQFIPVSPEKTLMEVYQTQYYAVAWTGRLYNRTELLNSMEDTRIDSNAVIIHNAYLKWGDAFVERLDGEYAFVLVELKNRSVLAVRDRMGMMPLFYMEGKREVVCLQTRW